LLLPQRIPTVQAPSQTGPLLRPPIEQIVIFQGESLTV
jgi:hypothetical protein